MALPRRPGPQPHHTSAANLAGRGAPPPPNKCPHEPVLLAAVKDDDASVVLIVGFGGR
jgi:hypothetical protein